MKKILIILLLFNLKFGHVFSIEPEIFVQSTVNRASQVLSKDISKEDKINELKSIAKETVDIRGIGFYTLGSARKNLDNDQKLKYFILFEKYFLKSFSSRLSEYTNPKIEVQGKEVLNKNYKPIRINKKDRNDSLVRRTIKKILFIDEKSGKN